MKQVQNKAVKLMRETELLLAKLVSIRAGGISASKLVTIALVDYARVQAQATDDFKLRKELFELIYDCELYLKHEYTLNLDKLEQSGGLVVEKQSELEKIKAKLTYTE